MTEQKKSDSQLATAEKIAPNGEKSANKPDKDARELSQDELDAVAGGSNREIGIINVIVNC